MNPAPPRLLRGAALGLLLTVLARPGSPAGQIAATEPSQGKTVMEKMIKSDEDWRRLLSPERYHILRQHGTEPAFSSPLAQNKSKGVYRCAACGLELFSSEHKYDSGTGWPSYWQPVAPQHLITRPDNRWFLKRTEVLCARCESHLGHVFPDGPPPTGQRYCINGLALEFRDSSP